MEDIESVRNLALRILYSKRTLSDLDEGVQSRSVDVDGLPMDKLDKGVLSPEDSSIGDLVPSVDGPKAMVSYAEPSTRRKRRTEVKNLEIDLKDWNSIYLNSNIQFLLSDERSFRNDKNNFDFHLFDEQFDNDFYESFIETQSFNDCILLT